jgi:hypothetical protein
MSGFGTEQTCQSSLPVSAIGIGADSRRRRIYMTAFDPKRLWFTQTANASNPSLRLGRLLPIDPLQKVTTYQGRLLVSAYPVQ